MKKRRAFPGQGGGTVNRRSMLQALGIVGAVATFAPRVLAAEPTGITPQGVADAWLAGLAPIEMAAARERMTDPRVAGQHAGLNRFTHNRALFGPRDRDITTPNNDTLYSSAWVDLTRGPVTLTVPDTPGRYLSVAIMDMYTNDNMVLGARCQGGAAGRYTLVGPDHRGPLDRRTLRVATPHAWVLGRVLVDGPSDLDAAHAAQDRLSMKGPEAGPYAPTAIRSDDWPEYFRSVDILLHADPPQSLAGFETLRAMKARSATFDRAAFGADAKLIDEGVAQAKAFLGAARGLIKFENGWQYPKPNLGNYGDDFRYRGLVAIAGLGALPRSEAMYMRAAGDTGKGVFLSDKTWRFSVPAALPVDAFWSLTMYEATPDGQFFLADNPIDRYAIGDRTRGLNKGPNGAVDLWIARSDPGGDRRSNWLPAPPKGPYAVILRTYLPRPEMMDGRYRLPPLEEV